jgi:hypothetical protein
MFGMLPGRVTYVVDKEGKIIMILTVCWLRSTFQSAGSGKLTSSKADNSSYKLQNTESCLVKIDKYEYKYIHYSLIL